MAYVGKARALLDLGRPADAAAVASPTNVPTTFVYEFGYSNTTNFTNLFASSTSPNSFFSSLTVRDRAGQNGLPYLSEPDPRVATIAVGQFSPMYVPAKYATPASPVGLASGVEARLIEAEAALAANNSAWLTMLNALRTNGTYTVTLGDTTWNAGSAGVSDLRPLTDPGSDSARVTLLFRERAYWLFVTGHRLGDLRRLIRQYQRQPAFVLTTGTLTNGLNTYAYSLKPNFEPPLAERQGNPKYTGCFNRDA